MSYRENNAMMGLVLAALGAAGYGTYLATAWLWKYGHCLLAAF